MPRSKRARNARQPRALGKLGGMTFSQINAFLRPFNLRASLKVVRIRRQRG